MSRGSRTAAEWTTLGASCVVLLVLVTLIVSELVSTRDPAAPTARLGEPVARVGDVFHVPVVVTNEGDETAAQVQVTASLEVGGEATEADQVIDFLAGHDEEDLVFIFADDPADGELTVEVSGFAQP